MAAYAAVVSVMNIMEQIQNHPRHSLSLDKKQTETLGEKLGFLEEFLENYSNHGDSNEIELLESQIASAAHTAEDVVEFHIVDQIQAGSVSLLDLQKVNDDMDSIKEKVMKFQEKTGSSQDLPPKFSTSSAASSRPDLTTEKSTMVGCEDELIQLLDVLTGQHSGRQIIPVNGMGGIGKTTLARNAYEHSLIVEHFDLRAWATISQEYTVKEILLQILSCLGKATSEMNRLSEDQLAEKLYKSLCGRRYLIILDDMWRVEAWGKIRLFFPDNGSRSRIVVTTRESAVANHFGSLCFEKKFLDAEKSWALFCAKVFAPEGCPPELEKIGKMIVQKCKGLPLSIVVIAGLLRKSTRRQEDWKNVAKSINSVLVSGEDEQCFKILSFSYRHLPAHLKPCFLYMRTYPEDYDIRVSELIRLWVAEGFLKPNKTQSLEEVAEDYLKDLIDRNLVLVGKLRSNGKIKTCYIHDTLRDLCLWIATKVNFLCEVRELDIPRGIYKERRRIVFSDTIQWDYALYKNSSPQLGCLSCEAPLARSLILEGPNWDLTVYDGDQGLTKFRLLRVLDVGGWCNAVALFQQFNFRYFASNYLFVENGEFPPSISLLWNLQTLISKGASGNIVTAPCEIWEMPQLRHLDFHTIRLSDPSPTDRQDDGFALPNLQTLSRVVDFRLSEEVCKRIPNLKKLKIHYTDFSARSSHYCLHNLRRFHKLESFNCIFWKVPKRSEMLQNLIFPDSLRKLTLINCSLEWEDLRIIGSLPNLEVLKLRGAVRGKEWNPVEGEFLRLKYLEVDTSYNLGLLYCWNADSWHFPVLETLVLSNLDKLEEIPSGIGEIATLRSIELFDCNELLAISAMRILEEQEENLGNEGLQVRVKFLDESDLERFRERVAMEESSFTSPNFRVGVRN